MMTDLHRMMEVARTDLAAASVRDDCKYKPGGRPGEVVLSPITRLRATRELQLAALVRDAGEMTRAQMIGASDIPGMSIGYVIRRAMQLGLLVIDKSNGLAVYRATGREAVQ